MSKSRFTIIISDCHLGGGRYLNGVQNPYEDFFFDDEMCDFFRFFSTDRYGFHPDGSPVEVELFINGDYLDFLAVPINGEFETAVHESMAVEKLEIIIKGHQKVMNAIRSFASLPGKKVRYLAGNHDEELHFEKVRERLTREWDPDGNYPSEKVQIIANQDAIPIGNAVEIHHGHQFETANALSAEKPFSKLTGFSEPVLDFPWGTIYVLKVLNRFKVERPFIDKIRPIKVFLLLGLVIDTWFTFRFITLSSMYFILVRVLFTQRERRPFTETLRILHDESFLDQTLERPARKILDQRDDLKTIIFGHTHHPMNRYYSDGKQYINTGTWTRMVQLDWRNYGQQLKLTFAHCEFKESEKGEENHTESLCELRHWVGFHTPHQVYNGT